MTEITIPIASDELKQEAFDAFATMFPNPDNLTSQGLLVKYVSNYILDQINSARIVSAQAAVQKLDTLS